MRFSISDIPTTISKMFNAWFSISEKLTRISKTHRGVLDRDLFVVHRIHNTSMVQSDCNNGIVTLPPLWTN